MGEAKRTNLRVRFDRRIRLQFQGAKVTSDAGLLAVRELDDAVGLTELGGVTLADTRTGRNIQHNQVALLRQKSAICILAATLLAAVGCGEKETKTQSNEVKQQPRQTQQRPPTTRQQQTYQQPSAQTVYIAPHSGECYHLNRNCRGLSNARSVQAVTKQQAVQAGYRACGICAK